MTEFIIIIVLVCINTVNTILLTLTGNNLYSQNEKLEQEIKELKIMLKDRIVHVTHKIRE